MRGKQSATRCRKSMKRQGQGQKKRGKESSIERGSPMGGGKLYKTCKGEQREGRKKGEGKRGKKGRGKNKEKESGGNHTTGQNRGLKTYRRGGISRL